MKRLLVFLLLLSNAAMVRALQVAIVTALPYQMDVRWQSAAAGAGYSAAIVPVNTLDNIASLNGVDVLVVSNALGALSPVQINTLRSFLQSGRSVYLQGEYLPAQPGNVAFAQLVNGLGGSFTWGSTLNNNLSPAVAGTLATTNLAVSTLPYFWYGCTAVSACNCTAFLSSGGQALGWQFRMPGTGRLILTSDQDWVLAANVYPASERLMKNILTHLADTGTGSQFLPASAVVTVVPGDTVCAGLPVTFTATPLNAGVNPAFQWKKNGISLAAGSNTYTTTGLVDGDVLCCVVTPANGCPAGIVTSNSIIMTVRPRKADTITLPVCSGQLPYSWHGISLAAGGMAVAAFTCPSVLTSCDSTTTLNLLVHDPDTVHQALSLCPGQLPYTWNGIQVPAGGMAAAIYTMVSAATGCDSTTILDIAAPLYTSVLDTAVCAGTMPFSFGGQVCSNGGNYVHTFTSSFGCDSVVTLLLHVSAAPVVAEQHIVSCGPLDFDGRHYEQSAVLRDTLHTSGNCDSLYHIVYLDLGSPVSDTVNAAICRGDVYWFAEAPYQDPGFYQHTYQTTAGCDSLVVLDLSVLELPGIRIQRAAPADALCAGDSVRLEATGGRHYEWFSGTASLGSGSSMAVFLAAGDNIVRVKGEDQFSCSNTDELLLVAHACCSLQMPNAFSPNGDGRNDQFGPISKARPDLYTLRIFNRWGRVLFTAATIDVCWDGTVNGIPADAGTYYYRIEGRCPGNIPIREQGNFTLIR